MRKHLAITARPVAPSVSQSRVTEGDERSELALGGPTLRCYVPVHFSRAALGQFSRALKAADHRNGGSAWPEGAVFAQAQERRPAVLSRYRGSQCAVGTGEEVPG